MKLSVSKTLRRMLMLLLVAALLMVQLPVYAAPEESTDLSAQDGLTLHCWNWSFKNIEEKLDIIASLGYTSIQTSPIQLAKQPTVLPDKGFPTNDWWVYYQPAGFEIDNTGTSALGTKADFESMCKAAHEKGIKVIVDVVANHMANTETGTNGLAETIIEDLKNDPDCWHDITKNTNDYSSRLEVTQYCMTSLPDLNTANDKVQTYVLNYLKECIDAGADGFRFDAVKHIETPDDGDLASDFWPTVIDGAKEYAQTSRGIELYCYGELLDGPGGSITPASYTKYMSVTDNNWSANLLFNVVQGGNANGFTAGYGKGDASQMVTWAESHDNYADESTRNISEENINKAWALIAARTGAMGLYLARPANFSQLLGAASNTAWSYPEVAEVNKFHNAFAGTTEYVANENGVAYVERGDSGVVLVNCKGTTADVNVTANTIADGTYTDQLTGNTFTVADGKISGTIGETGIAVVYSATPCTHAAHDADGFCTVCFANVGHTYDENSTCSCGDVKVSERTIYFTAPTNWSAVNFYSWYDDINIISGTWPGNPMTKGEKVVNEATSSAYFLYSCTLPADAPNIIFNDGGSTQTEDLTVPAESEGLNMYDYINNKWVTYSGEASNENTEPTEDTTVSEDTTPTEDTTPSQDPEATTPSEEPTATEATEATEGNKDSKDSKDSGSSAGLWIAIIAVAVMAVAVIAALVIKKKK